MIKTGAGPAAGGRGSDSWETEKEKKRFFQGHTGKNLRKNDINRRIEFEQLEKFTADILTFCKEKSALEDDIISENRLKRGPLADRGEASEQGRGPCMDMQRTGGFSQEPEDDPKTGEGLRPWSGSGGLFARDGRICEFRFIPISGLCNYTGNSIHS